jgi:hypothetical protein
MSREGHAADAADAAQAQAEYELRVTLVDHLERIADALEAHVDLVQTANYEKRAQVKTIDFAIEGLIGLIRGFLEGSSIPDGVRLVAEDLHRIFVARIAEHKS